MIDTKWRTPFQTLLIDPLLRIPLIARRAPLTLTLLAALSGLCIPLLLAYHASLMALMLLALSGLCDVLDGSIARKQQCTSPIGAACDITSDRLVECCILIGLYLYDPARALPVMVMMGASLLCVTTFLVVGIFSENASEKSFHYSAGLIERGEAFIFFACMIVLPGYFLPLSILYSGLVLLTATIRLKQFGLACCKQSC